MCKNVKLSRTNWFLGMDPKKEENANHNEGDDFVVTGFGPFGDVRENPTSILVKNLSMYLLEHGTMGCRRRGTTTTRRDEGEEKDVHDDRCRRHRCHLPSPDRIDHLGSNTTIKYLM